MKKISRPDTPLTPTLPKHMRPYDTDGDGKLDRDERAAYNKAKMEKAKKAKKVAQEKNLPSTAEVKYAKQQLKRKSQGRKNRGLER